MDQKQGQVVLVAHLPFGVPQHGGPQDIGGGGFPGNEQTTTRNPGNGHLTMDIQANFLASGSIHSANALRWLGGWAGSCCQLSNEGPWVSPYQL
mmetsp:Transcript_919/g.1860  ORF Transcript_919/g.1860 Transcript_919/m.1860 type:complete len:94 (-) Transcript_919:66-347(-)